VPNAPHAVTRRLVLVLVTTAGASVPSATAQVRFADATERLGLDAINAQHAAFVDLDADGLPDLVVQRTRVFMNRPADGGGRRFEEVRDTGLPELERGDVTAFADVDGDGLPDAIIARHLPPSEGDSGRKNGSNDDSEGGEQAEDAPPAGALWLAGRGDGSFGAPTPIDAAPPAPAAAIATGDLNRDGLLDVVIGNWYARYGESYAGVANTVLLGTGGGSFQRAALPEADVPFDRQRDAGGRPTYGVLIADLLPQADAGHWPEVLALNYGRRWNRLWRPTEGGWRDAAGEVGIDGDGVRHGRYPDWLKERARTDPRFDRPDEPPFRANGNTFDAAVGDYDNDGDFDLLLTEITHGWAGESSDRTRLLLREDGIAGPVFTTRPGLSLDRTPADPTLRSWNQGDIYGELADLDLDARPDVLLCSSDYPDNQRLRIFRQQEDGSLEDVTPWSGIDHIGAGRPSLADFDGDGDQDLAVGQSFNRLSKAQRAGRTPRLRVFENLAADDGQRRGLVIRLTGESAAGVNTAGVGAIIRVTATVGGRTLTQSRQLPGVGGHQGKQHAAAAHFALGQAPAERVEIAWPHRDGLTTTLHDLDAGTHTIAFPHPDR